MSGVIVAIAECTALGAGLIDIDIYVSWSSNRRDWKVVYTRGLTDIWETDMIEMQREPFYRLMGFVIDKSCRSNGMGGMVLEKAIGQIYKEFGKRPITLGCHKDNIRAARFYMNHGFKRTGVYEGNDDYYLRSLKKIQFTFEKENYNLLLLTDDSCSIFE